MSLSLKNLIIIMTLTLACTVAAAGQESKCLLKLAELPLASELHGFRIGMNIEQLKARLPKMQVGKQNEFGFTTFNIFPDYEPGIDKTAFAGVRTVSLELLDGRVFSLWIGYDKSFKWQALDEFVAGITVALKLPGSWRAKSRARLLDCADFTVAVIPVGQSPSIKITDNAAKELLNNRQAAQEETQP